MSTPTEVIPSAQPTPDDPTSNAVENTTCIVQITAYPYTVQSGDTLSVIAERASTTVRTLSDINCLENADILFEGQTLYLPQQLIQPDTANSQSVPVVRLPGTPFSNGAYILARGSTMLIDIENTPSSTTRIELYLSQNGVNTVVATDTNAADGFSIVYTVEGSEAGEFFAIAYDSAGRELIRSGQVPVRAETVGIPGV